MPYNPVLQTPLYGPEEVFDGGPGGPNRMKLDARTGAVKYYWDTAQTQESILACRPGLGDIPANRYTIIAHEENPNWQYIIALSRFLWGKGTQSTLGERDTYAYSVYLIKDGVVVDEPMQNLMLIISGTKFNSFCFEKDILVNSAVVPGTYMATFYTAITSSKGFVQVRNTETNKVTKRGELKVMNPDRLPSTTNLTTGIKSMNVLKVPNRNLIDATLLENAFPLVDGVRKKPLFVIWSLSIVFEDDFQTQYVSDPVTDADALQQLYDAEYDNESWENQLTIDNREPLTLGANYFVAADLYYGDQAIQIMGPAPSGTASAPLGGIAWDYSVGPIKEPKLTQAGSGDELQFTGVVDPVEVEDELYPQGVVMACTSGGKIYYKTVVDYTVPGPDRTAAYPNGDDMMALNTPLPFGGAAGKVNVDKRITRDGWYEKDAISNANAVNFMSGSPVTIDFNSSKFQIVVVNGDSEFHVSVPKYFTICEDLVAIPQYTGSMNPYNGFDVNYAMQVRIDMDVPANFAPSVAPHFAGYVVSENGQKIVPVVTSADQSSQTIPFSDTNDHTIAASIGVYPFVYLPVDSPSDPHKIETPISTANVIYGAPSPSIQVHVYTNQVVPSVPLQSNVLFTTPAILGDAAPVGDLLLNNVPQSDLYNKTTVKYEAAVFSDAACLNKVASGGEIDYAYVVEPTNVNNPAGWSAYANVFDKNDVFLFGSVWGLSDLKSTLVDNTVTLQPNFNTYSNATTSDDIAYWRDGLKGNRLFEGFTRMESLTQFTGKGLLFTGNVVNTLSAGYTAHAYIRALDPSNGYFKVLDKLVPLANGTFSIRRDEPFAAGLLVQYGFVIKGLNANPAEEGLLGNVVVTNVNAQQISLPAINVPFMAALPDLNAGDLTTWTAIPLDTWQVYSILYKPGTPTMENFRTFRTLEGCNSSFDNVNQSGVIAPFWQNSPSDRDNARYVTTIFQTITDATLFNQGIQFSGKIKSRTLLSSYTVSAYIQTTGGSAQSNSNRVQGSTFTARLNTIPAGTTKIEVGFRFDAINLFAQNGVDGKLLGNLELENIQIGKPVIKGTSPWTGYVSGVSSTNATILSTPIIPEASGSTFDAVNHTAVILPWWSNSADRDGAIYTLEMGRDFYDPSEFNKGIQFSGIVESRTLLASYKVEAFLKCWTSTGYDYGIQIFADVVNGCSFFVRRNSLPANTNRVACGFRITGTNLLSQNGVDGTALGNVVLKNLLVEKTLFNDNTDYYLQTTVKVVEKSYVNRDVPVKSVAFKKRYYTRPGLTTLVNTDNPTPVDALFSKRTLTNILLDITKVKWYNNAFLWSTYSDTESEDPLGSLQFALENYNTLTVPLTPNAPTALQPYIPVPALTDAKAYIYLLNYKSASYPNNHQLKQSIQIKPDPPNFPNMKFYTTTLTEAAKLVVDALPPSSAAKTYYANLYENGVRVGTHNFLTNTPVTGLVNAVSYTVKLYLVENGISTDEGTGVVVKYHDRPTLSLTGDFMYSSMASQVDPVDASKRLEAVLNLNCVDMKGASGTATIVASGSIVPGVINLSTSSVNMSAVNYISLIINDYFDGGHAINIVSVVGGWSIPNIDKVNYLVIGNVWDGPVTLIDSNIQGGILMGSRFKITTPTPLVLGSQWSRNGQVGILYVPLFPITPAPSMSIVVPSSLAMTGVVVISSATTTPTTENYIQVQIHSYSNGGHDLYISTSLSGKDTADLRNMTYLKLGSVWDGPVTFISKTGNLNELRITTPTPLNFSGTNIIWNAPHNTYATTYVKFFPVTLQPTTSLVTLPGMTTGMTLQVSVVTDTYPNTPSVSISNIPLYLVDATVQVLSIDQNKNPRARDLFNELCTLYRYKVFLSDVPNSTGLSYTLNDDVHFPISTPLESEAFFTEWLTPAAKTAPTQTLSIYSTYLGTTPKQLIYKQTDLQVAFEPFIDYDKNTKTGKIFGVGSPINSISLIDRLGNTYPTSNTSVFTKVNENYNYTFNNIPNSDFSGWMMMARNDVGVTDSLNGRFFHALNLLDHFTGDSYLYITGMEFKVIGGHKMLSLKTSDIPTPFTGIRVYENSNWKELPSNEFTTTLLSENQLSTQLKLKVVDNRVVETRFPMWMGGVIMNLMTSSVPYSYQQLLVNKNVMSPLLSIDMIQLDKCPYQMGGFNSTPGVVDVIPSVTTELYNKHLAYSATNQADTRVINFDEGFFFSLAT
jgi:hypothetical protein